MIIQCEKCQTKFRLDDSKVTDKGVKVRCAKCKHVFTVKKEEPDAFLGMEESAVASSSPAFQSDVTADAYDERSFAPEPAVQSSAADTILFEDAPASADFSSFETSSFDATAQSFDSDELDVTGTETAPDAVPEPAASGGEVDFSSFDFGDSVSEPDVTPASNLSLEDFSDEASESVPSPAPPRKEAPAPQGLDFSEIGRAHV